MPLATAQSWITSLFCGESKVAPHAEHDIKVINDLRHDGVSVTSLDRLLGAGNSEYHASVKTAQDLVGTQPASTNADLWTRGLSSTDLTADALLTHLPALYLLGLHVNILRIVEAYLGSPPAYHGAVLRHSLVDGASVRTRLWHQDAEDRQVFRVVLYLNDVHEGGGPFEYIPRHLGVTYKKFAGVSDAITNDRMAAVVHPNRWKRVIAPAGTVVIADTAKVFHHESLQISAERAVVMFGYSSRKPRRLDLAMSHFPVERVQAQLRSIIPSENVAHVFDWRHMTN